MFTQAVIFQIGQKRQDIREYFEGLETGEIQEPPEDLWETVEEREAQAGGTAGSADGYGY
ncbi:MAG: hypothetical protein LBD29_09430 [Treponema sp.]|jgi:hypothetical protein|nr:hypothetical protein [Treponema sp.]